MNAKFWFLVLCHWWTLFFVPVTITVRQIMTDVAKQNWTNDHNKAITYGDCNIFGFYGEKNKDFGFCMRAI